MNARLRGPSGPSVLLRLLARLCADDGRRALNPFPRARPRAVPRSEAFQWPCITGGFGAGRSPCASSGRQRSSRSSSLSRTSEILSWSSLRTQQLLPGSSPGHIDVAVGRDDLVLQRRLGVVHHCGHAGSSSRRAAHDGTQLKTAWSTSAARAHPHGASETKGGEGIADPFDRRPARPVARRPRSALRPTQCSRVKSPASS